MTQIPEENTTDSTSADSFEAANRAAQERPSIQPAPPVLETPVDDIPEDVRKQMIGLERMELDQQLIRILATPGHIYSVDRIVLSLWLVFSRKCPRETIQARLRSMVKAGYLTKDPRGRGIFTIIEEGKAIAAAATPAATGAAA